MKRPGAGAGGPFFGGEGAGAGYTTLVHKYLTLDIQYPSTVTMQQQINAKQPQTDLGHNRVYLPDSTAAQRSLHARHEIAVGTEHRVRVVVLQVDIGFRFASGEIVD